MTAKPNTRRGRGKKKQADSLPDEVNPSGYTIDELTAATGVPSRTIRFYQSKGTLEKPEIRGRRPPRMPPTCSSFVMRLDAIVKHSTVRYVLREGVRFVRGASAVK